MPGWNLPDDVNECVVCGAPIYWSFSRCDGCEPKRDDKGRFVKRDTPMEHPIKESELEWNVVDLGEPGT